MVDFISGSEKFSTGGPIPEHERQRVSFERSGFLTADRLIKVAAPPTRPRTGFIKVASGLDRLWRTSRSLLGQVSFNLF